MAEKRKITPNMPFEAKPEPPKVRAPSTCSKCGAISMMHKSAHGHESALENLRSKAASNLKSVQDAFFAHVGDLIQFTEEQRTQLADTNKTPAHPSLRWNSMESFQSALHCPGRIFVVLLLHLGAKLSTTKEYTTSALFKWASMISMGKQATFLQVPAEVAARAHDSVWSDSEQAPSSRAKKSSAKKIEIIHPSPAQQAILGRPPPAASAASGLSSCAPGTLWEAGFAPQAILPAQDIGDACHSDWCAAPLVVPVAKVSQVYELLRDEAQSAVQDMEGDLQWCNVPVPHTEVAGLYERFAALARSNASPFQGKMSNSQSSTVPPVALVFALPGNRVQEFTQRVTVLLSPEKVVPTWQVADVLGPLREHNQLSEDTLQAFTKLGVTSLSDLHVLVKEVSLIDMKSDVPSLNLMEWARIRNAVDAAVKELVT